MMARTHVGVALAPCLTLLSEATAGGASGRHPMSPALARCACPFGGNRARAVELGIWDRVDVCPPLRFSSHWVQDMLMDGMQFAARSPRQLFSSLDVGLGLRLPAHVISLLTFFCEHKQNKMSFLSSELLLSQYRLFSLTSKPSKLPLLTLKTI